MGVGSQQAVAYAVQRFENPFDQPARFHHDVGVQCHAGLHRLDFAVSKHVLTVQRDLHTVQRLVYLLTG